MAENKMEAVAKLFGKKLGEEFEMVWRDIVFVAKITEDGLEADCPCRHWDSFLVGLLTGEAVIVDE